MKVHLKFIQAMLSVYGAAIHIVYHPDFGRDFIRMGFKNAKTS